MNEDEYYEGEESPGPYDEEEAELDECEDCGFAHEPVYAEKWRWTVLIHGLFIFLMGTAQVFQEVLRFVGERVQGDDIYRENNLHMLENTMNSIKQLPSTED